MGISKILVITKSITKYKILVITKSAHPTVVASVTPWQSTVHEIGESWVRFPLRASDFSSICSVINSS